MLLCPNAKLRRKSSTETRSKASWSTPLRFQSVHEMAKHHSCAVRTCARGCLPCAACSYCFAAAAATILPTRVLPVKKIHPHRRSTARRRHPNVNDGSSADARPCSEEETIFRFSKDMIDTLKKTGVGAGKKQQRLSSTQRTLKERSNKRSPVYRGR